MLLIDTLLQQPFQPYGSAAPSQVQPYGSSPMMQPAYGVHQPYGMPQPGYMGQLQQPYSAPQQAYNGHMLQPPAATLHSGAVAQPFNPYVAAPPAYSTNMQPASGIYSP
jgi:hypothetical protein